MKEIQKRLAQLCATEGREARFIQGEILDSMIYSHLKLALFGGILLGFILGIETVILLAKWIF